MGIADDLERLDRLRRDGTLTEEEFSRAKASLLEGDAADRPGRTPGNRSVSRRWLVTAVAAVAAVAAAVTLVVALGGDEPRTAAECERLAQEQLDLGRPTAEVNPYLEDNGCGVWLDEQLAAAEADDLAVEEELTEEPAEEPIYSDSVVVEESGWTPMVDGSLASWGAVLDNPTGYFPFVDLTVEQLDTSGTIVESTTMSLTIEPETKASVGGMVPLARDAEELGFSVTMNNYSEPDEDFFVPNAFDVSGTIHGRELSSEVTVEAYSSNEIGGFCPVYLLFRDLDANIVGGASVEDHPAIPAGSTKTFKKHFTDNVLVPAAAQSVVGYPDASDCW